VLQVPLECEAECKHLGRVVLRSEGQTIAAGKVRAVLA
jgi:translation elongation factor EF-1alpha